MSEYMTIKDLRDSISRVPDDMKVYFFWEGQVTPAEWTETEGFRDIQGEWQQRFLIGGDV